MNKFRTINGIKPGILSSSMYLFHRITPEIAISSTVEKLPNGKRIRVADFRSIGLDQNSWCIDNLRKQRKINKLSNRFKLYRSTC